MGSRMTSLRRTLPPDDQLGLFDLAAEVGGPARGLAVRTIDSCPARKDRHDVFNARLLKGLTVVGPYDIPRIEPCQLVPAKLIAFSEAMSMPYPDPDAWVHFYEDDHRYMGMWNKPEAQFHRLGSFAGVISPDFSVYRNIPVAQKIDHIYRNQLLGARMQADGASVIANVRLSGRSSIPYALAGAPRRSTIAIGLHGCTKDKSNRPYVIEEVAIICEELSPSSIVAYGSAGYGVLDHPRRLGVPVHVYQPDTFHRSHSRKGAA
jgi:hypothetical protein